MNKKIAKKSQTKFWIALTPLLLVSCSENFDNPSQYSNIGFDKGRRVEDATRTIPNLTPAKAVEAVSPGYYSDGNQDFSSQGARDTVAKYQATQNASAPSQQPQSYYQQAPQGYYAQPQPYYQQAPQGYYAPQPQPYYQPQVVPASRFYSNPYAIPPANQAPQYYDSDQYYAAPTYYRADAPQSSTQRRPQ